MYPEETFSYGAARTAFLYYVFVQTNPLRKQYRTRSDATLSGVWSGSTLFAIRIAVLHTAAGSQMGLLKRQDK